MSGARRRFRFIKEIAEGGFGKVYLAEQLSSDGFSRIVAAKLLHAKWSSHDEVVMRTRDEARLLGLIRHQHIVRVEDLTSIDGKCAIIMEYLEGVDLKYVLQYLRDRHMTFPRAALFEIASAVASALDAAYNGRPLQGGDPLRVIHRDIKPSNIFVTIAGGVKVLDFGTARANFAEREAKTQALAFGSQGYMAPERMLGEEDTPAADIFSLGITLYELLTLEAFGRIPPRPQKFVKKVEERIAAVPLEGPSEWTRQVRDVLRAMCAYDSKERPSATSLVDVFEALAQGASDAPLKKFCRTTVAESKANEPDLETGDPLTGQVIEEDASSAFGPGAGPSTAAAAASVAPAPSRTAAVARVNLPIDGPTEAPSERSGTTDVVRSSGGGGGMKIAAAAIVGLGGVLVVVLIAVAVVAYVLSTEMSSGPTTVVTTPPDPPPDNVTAPPDAGGGAVGGGGTVVSRDTREGVPSSTATVLSMVGGPAEVVITGGVGFKAEWDGAAPFDVGALPAGTYRANITPQGGAKLRNKSFTVEADKACAFTFDVAAGDWSGGCP
jgi:serine/threonine protein kinase